MDSLILRDLSASGFAVACESDHHRKALPCFSVVQALRGSYDIGLDDGPVCSTGEGGVFVTPPGCMQHITHHNGREGFMEAQWVFFDVLVDDRTPLSHLFTFPLLLPAVHNQEVAGLIRRIREEDSLCLRYAAAYSLLDILMRYAQPATPPDPLMQRLQEVVYQHAEERLTADWLAHMLHCSVSQVFRLTRRYFDKTPAHYINFVLLQKAARLLESSDLPIKEIALSCGFYDTAYFSRLFSCTFRIAPSRYRREKSGE